MHPVGLLSFFFVLFLMQKNNCLPVLLFCRYPYPFSVTVQDAVKVVILLLPILWLLKMERSYVWYDGYKYDEYYCKRIRKRDLDNMIKFTFDALQGRGSC